MNTNSKDLDLIAESLEAYPEQDPRVRTTLYPKQNESPAEGSDDTSDLDQVEKQSTDNLPELSASLSSTRGQTLSGRKRFHLVHQVGEGSFGLVWEATDNDLNRSVAIKEFKGTEAKAKQRCQDEIRYIGQLDHPSVPTIYDTAFTDGGVPYVVMKLLEGQTLGEIIRLLKEGDLATHKKYTFEKRVMLIIQLLRAVKASHHAEILHRDIKPGNVLVNPDGHLWLIDWGCAVKLSDVKENSSFCGTPLYMAPEQILCRGLTPASDLFAVAGVAYELMSLHISGPKCSSVRETVIATLDHQPPYFDHLYHESQGYPPSEFSLIIMQALNRQVELRPQSADEMIVWLEGALSGEIEVICDRTRLKHLMCSLMAWVNRDPIPRLKLLKMGLALSILGCLFIGGVCSALIF